MNEVQQRTDVYALVTDRIIAQLEKGSIPWEKPWTDAGLPENIVNKTFYRGINVLLLASLGFERNAFLTWDQVKQAGGSVKRGEKGCLVVFWKIIEKEVEGQPEPQKMQFLRYHTVFNVAQCANLPEKLLTEALPLDKPNDSIAACEKVVAGMPQRPDIRHKEAEAYYEPVDDYVNMPRIKKFTSSEAYYGTLFHELTHSTGHQSRLAREGVTQKIAFGTLTYSFEELVAEIGACFLQSIVGIHTPREQQNRIAYLQGWLEALKGDKKLIIHASGHAQRATDFILGHTAPKSAE